MLPPRKTISFKPAFKVGGDIIKNYLTEKLSIDEKEATTLISDYVTEIKLSLKKNNVYDIDGVGKFSLDSTGRLIFKAFDEETHLVDSFGLEPLPVEESFEQNLSLPTTKKVLRIRPRNNTLTFVIAGITTISLLLAITVFISARFDLYLFNIGDSTTTNDLIILGKEPSPESGHHQLEKHFDEVTSVKTALQFKEPETKKPEPPPSTYYIIVAGSFRGFNNAQELQSKLKKEGFTVEIIEAGGYFRVSIGKFTDKPKALVELKRIRTQIDRSIWLLTISDI